MANLESLPEDVKRLICVELDKCQSVRPLWQVSKTWRAVAESFVYRGLAWAVTLKDSSISDDAKRLFADDIVSKYLEHARYLYISDTLKRHSCSTSSNESCSGDPSTEDSIGCAHSTGLSIVPPTFQLAEPISPCFNEVFCSDSKVDRSTAEHTWSPFIAALTRFKHLTDIVLQVQSRIPPGLMNTIERYHPNCRLHLRNFRFKSLHEEVTDPDERALAMSKNLHSLSILYMYRDSNGVDDHNGAAALRTVGLAKNLKHVRMLGCRPASSPALFRARERPLEKWKGFVPAIEEEDEGREGKGREKTKLESLSFVCYSNALNITKLEKWEQVADFSQLKTLSCSTGNKAFLSLVATDDKFPSLKDLNITLQPGNRENSEDWQLTVEQFFASLHPLTSLGLSGTLHGHLLDIIAERHGETLQKLTLKPFEDGYDTPGPPLRITAPFVELLASKAPNLTSLHLTLKRSMGDTAETRCYEALGTLQSLNDLRLSLDCTNDSAWDLSPEEDWDSFDKATQTSEGTMPKHYNGHLKIAMINSALDEDLVRQIWGVINENRTKDTLQTLNIYTYGGSSFSNSHPGDLMEIVQHVSRSYRVTANPNVEGGVEIVELSKNRREERDASQRKSEQSMMEKWGQQRHCGSSYVVFQHIWPFEDHEDWRTKWKSWPLQRAT
ncbi:uncharacterized protein BDR25DRAFT_305060 [Lindgomyces ingoldianus]|uniref:Uncharacterized protein n=1 Tax=Lindgomyces ingoldianus TaxID=673940 RepID=A0ACB6QQG7_9PLEO|nr:uncharacterized protein BDR25DRAFT_305060 [Lindgomyces ingoldianus]KAF2468411.1 hypothetical protein BDR25DRAFT_305060 [Lindgomyces ingoldianus]